MATRRVVVVVVVGRGERRRVCFGPHTDKVILRPSVTSSGSTRRKSRMQAWLATSFPRVDTTVGSTSFHDCIWMARMARHTHSWTRTGLGPGANFLSSSRIWLRRAGRSASETWVPRSYVIWRGGQRLLSLVSAGGAPPIPCAMCVCMYLALEGGRGKELCFGLARVLEDGYRRGPRIVLRPG